MKTFKRVMEYQALKYNEAKQSSERHGGDRDFSNRCSAIASIWNQNHAYLQNIKDELCSKIEMMKRKEVDESVIAEVDVMNNYIRACNNVLDLILDLIKLDKRDEI